MTERYIIDAKNTKTGAECYFAVKNKREIKDFRNDPEWEIKAIIDTKRKIIKL